MDVVEKRMTEDYVDSLFERVKAMTEQERLRLDHVAASLDDFDKSSQPEKGWRFCANRIVALAAIDVYRDWERMLWDRE